MGFSFLEQASWHMQKSLKNDRKITQNHKQLPSEKQNIPTFTSPKKKS
jgi:hypothetical protein